MTQCGAADTPAWLKKRVINGWIRVTVGGQRVKSDHPFGFHLSYEL